MSGLDLQGGLIEQVLIRSVVLSLMPVQGLLGFGSIVSCVPGAGFIVLNYLLIFNFDDS